MLQKLNFIQNSQHRTKIRIFYHSDKVMSGQGAQSLNLEWSQKKLGQVATLLCLLHLYF